jgi:hypothetical protein
MVFLNFAQNVFSLLSVTVMPAVSFATALSFSCFGCVQIHFTRDSVWPFGFRVERKPQAKRQ